MRSWIGVAALMLAGCECGATPAEPSSPLTQTRSVAVEVSPTPTPTPAPEPADPPLRRSPATERGAAAAAHAAIQLRTLRALLEPSPLVHEVPIEHPERLAGFYEALYQLELGASERVRIAVYGSSSIAGDRFTGYLRGYLQARFGDGGPGFVALVPLWRWHRHQEIVLEASRAWSIDHALRPQPPMDGRYGLMGVRATARARGARVELELRGLSEAIERWEIWFDAGPGRGSFEVTLDGAAPQIIETAAPELGPGYAELTSEGGHRELTLRTHGDGPVHLFGAVLESHARAIVIDELGIGGSGARRVVEWDEGLWSAHLARREPALVILAYGGIESMRRAHEPDRFTRELDEILTRIERATPEASCLLLAPQDRAHRNDDGERERPATLDGIIAIERRVAADHGCAFFDTQAMMGGPGTMPTWVEAELARDDHVHFSPRGYAHMGRVFVDALMRPYDADE